MKTIDLLDKPKIIGVVGDVNTGKSNYIYNVLKEIKDKYKFNLYTYGLRCNLGEQKIYSIQEMEDIRDSLIVCDEYFTLFDLDDRKARRSIENTLRLINHNNNILILIGLPENFKKFISNKLDAVIYKNCKIGDFTNGSRAKSICLNYKGHELGSAVLSLEKNEALVYDGKHYNKIIVPYIKDCDTKLNNEKIVQKIVLKNVEKGNSYPHLHKQLLVI